MKIFVYEAEALNNLGHIARDHGDYTLARARYEESLALWQKTDDQWGTAATLNSLGMIMSDVGTPQAALSYYTHSFELYEQLNDITQCAFTLSNLGAIAYEQKAFADALCYFERSLSHFEDIEHKWGIEFSLNNMAEVYYELGNFDAAKTRCKVALGLRAELGGYSEFAYTLETLAKIARVCQDWSRAAKLYAIAAMLRERFQTPMTEAQQQQIDNDIALIRNVLNDEFFYKEWNKGQAMPVETIVSYAVEESDA